MSRRPFPHDRPARIAYNNAMPFILLHTGDLHLGKSFRGLPPSRADQRRQDLLGTLQRICATARERKADLLIIAGDLFDRAVPTETLYRETRTALEDAGVPVLVIPGNHDPLEPFSPYLDDRWPKNTRVASAPGWQRIDGLDREIWAFGYTTVDAYQSAWTTFPGCGPEAILALHASCLAPGVGDEGQYYRFVPLEIPTCAYLALGHHHRFNEICDTPTACYCGSPEPLEAQDAEAGAVLVTLNKAVSATLLPLASRRHRAMSLNITGLAADEVYKRALALSAPEDLFTLRLTGLVNPDDPLDAGTLESELAKHAFYARVDDRDLLIPTDAGEHVGVMGALLEIVRNEMTHLTPEHPDFIRLQRAGRYAQLALEGKLGCG